MEWTGVSLLVPMVILFSFLLQVTVILAIIVVIIIIGQKHLEEMVVLYEKGIVSHSMGLHAICQAQCIAIGGVLCVLYVSLLVIKSLWKIENVRNGG
jgi:hypothetical protein